MMADKDGAANSVRPLPLQGGGLGWGSRRNAQDPAVAPKSTPTRLHELRIAKLMQPTSPFQGEAELAARVASPRTITACLNAR